MRHRRTDGVKQANTLARCWKTRKRANLLQAEGMKQDAFSKSRHETACNARRRTGNDRDPGEWGGKSITRPEKLARFRYSAIVNDKQKARGTKHGPKCRAHGASPLCSHHMRIGSGSSEDWNSLSADPLVTRKSIFLRNAQLTSTLTSLDGRNMLQTKCI